MSKALFDILNTGRSSLLVHQQAISTTSNNTANVSTAGYSKRELLFTSVSGEEGINIRTYRRTLDSYLASQLLDAESEHGYADAQSTTLSAVQQLYREGNGGMGESIDELFNSMRALSLEPSNSDRRRAVLEAGTAVSQTISSTAQRLFNERRAADILLDSEVHRVNEITKSIAELNVEIARLPSPNAENGALLDRQESMLRDLSGLVGVTNFRAEDGRLTVLLEGGQALVQADKAATLTATPDPALSNLRRVDLVSISGMPFDVTNHFSKGRIGGIIQVRDQTLTGLVDRVDQLAYDLATQINAIHSAGFGSDGATGRDFFLDPGGTVAGYSSQIRLDAAVDGNPTAIAASSTLAQADGGNDNLQALLDLEDLSVAGAGSRTFAQEIADMVGDVGRQGETNATNLSRATLALDNLSGIRESEVGVSLDEEMIDLMRFQRAYQAGSKIIQTVTQMYDTLLQM